MGNLIWKELINEWRSREIVTSMFIFGLTITLIFALAFNVSPIMFRQFAPGLLWVVILFTSVLGLNRLFSYERDMDAHWSWISAPIDRGYVFISKVLVGFIFLSIAELLFIFPFFLFLNIDLSFSFPLLFVTLGLGNGAIMSIGCLISGLALRADLREVLIPVLLFPIASPVIIAATKSTVFIFQDKPFGEWRIWILILLTFLLIFVLLGYLLYDQIVED